MICSNRSLGIRFGLTSGSDHIAKPTAIGNVQSTLCDRWVDDEERLIVRGIFRRGMATSATRRARPGESRHQLLRSGMNLHLTSDQKVRRMLPAAAFTLVAGTVLGVTAVADIGDLLPGDRPTAVVVAAVFALGVFLGWVMPLYPSGTSGRRSGFAAGVAIAVSLGIAALRRPLEARFPAIFPLLFTVGAGWAATVCVRIVWLLFTVTPGDVAEEERELDS